MTTDNRTNEPTEAQVEAAAKVLLRDYQSEYDGGEVSEFLDLARAVLEAADAVCCAHPKCPGGSLCCCQSDAVVTEGEVEEVLRQAFEDWDDEVDDLFAVQARAVVSLFRGGVK